MFTGFSVFPTTHKTYGTKGTYRASIFHHADMERHAFSTTVTLSNGVPIESISKMFGHKPRAGYHDLGENSGGERQDSEVSLA